MTKPTKAILSLLGGAALGAGAMYFYDPKLGGKRRARAGDAALLAKKKLVRAADTTSRTVKQRATQLYDGSRELFGRASGSAVSAWSPRNRAVLAAAGLLLATLAGVKTQA